MKYWIKDVAKLLGMTTEGVRFFERQGIVTPHRDVENNYRFYDRVQLIDLEQIQKYQKFGFTLKESEDLLRSSEKDEISDALAAQKKKLIEEQKDVQRKTLATDEMIKSIEYLKKSDLRTETVEIPDLSFLPLEGDLAPGKEEAIKAEKSWNCIESAKLSRVVMHSDGSPCNEKGLLISKVLQNRYHFPDYPYVVHLPKHFSYKITINRAIFDDSIYPQLYSQIKDAGYVPCGEMISEIQLTYTENGVRKTIENIFMHVNINNS